MARNLLALAALLCGLLGLAAPMAEARTVSGSLTYRERIALPEGAEWRVEITAPDGQIVTHAEPAGDRQVPFDFDLDAPEGPLVLRAAILVGDRPAWWSGSVPIPAGAGDAALGPVILRAHVAQPFRSWLLCGDRIFGLGFDGEDAVLSLGTDSRRLPAIPDAAQDTAGRHFADEGETDERQNAVRTDGTAVAIRWQGQDMPDCQPLALPPETTLTARGNEPGWVLRMDQDGAALSTESGEMLALAPLPQPDPTPDSLQWMFPGLAVTLAAGPCADSMTGMPYPLTATLQGEGIDLSGCAGDPMLLLQGDWQVTTLADTDLADTDPAGAEAPNFTIQGDAISGHSGCNRFNATLALDGESLRIGPAAVTRMACPPDRMALEAAFLAALQATDRFDIGPDGALILIAADREMLRAER